MSPVFRSLLLLCCLLPPQALRTSLAAEPATDPILRIEQGTHSDDIRGYAMDTARRWLVTASADKTARVWEAATGRQVAVLRPPSDMVSGALNKAAISNDGNRIVVGGNAGRSWFGSNAAFVFDRQGTLIRSLPGFSSEISSIVLTPDNRWLIIGTYAEIKIFDFSTFQLTGSIAEGHSSPNLDIAVSNTGWFAYARLATTPPPGHGWLTMCRLQQGRPLCDKPLDAQPGYTWEGMAFSPDGTRFAAGQREYFSFKDGGRGAVHVYALPGLEMLSQLDTSGLPYGDVFDLAWAQDDCVAGVSRDRIRIWDARNASRFVDVAGFPKTVDQIFASPGCRISAVVKGDLFKVDKDARSVGSPVARMIASVLPLWRYEADELRTVGVPASSGRPPATRFNLRTRLFDRDATAETYIDRSSYTTLSDPKEVGAMLAKSNKAFEAVRNALELPDRRSVLVCSRSKLSLVRIDGTAAWTSPVPNRSNRIALSPDQKLVTAYFPDGTVRWFRIADGAEILAFFPHADGKRWILWTPSGYYDASPGGEDLIGWHLNRDKNSAADFFPASRFRSRFYRPDVITKILDTLDEREALVLANAEAGRRPDAAPAQVQAVLPPVAEIVSPDDGQAVSAGEVTIRYRTRSAADAPVTAMRVRVNGLATGQRNLVVQAAGEVQTMTVPIPARDSEIQLFAENRNGVSTPATVRVKWAGRLAAAEEGNAYKPKLYVLAVGVSQYANPAYNLGLAAKDAQDFAGAFAAQKGKLYADVQVRLLTDASATRDDVVDGLEWLKREVTARDVGMLFLAGHGMNDNTGNYFYLPHNADPERLLRTGVAQNDIKLTLNTLAGKAVFFVDTCHSGNVLGTAKTRALGADVNAFVNELSSAENGVVVFAASTGRQYSLEDPAWGNGAFTKALVEGLNGKADFQHNGKITHKGLDYYVAERVKELTRGQQSPVSIAPSGVPDFPIAVLAH